MNICPACNQPRRGRYCNDAHPMRRTRPMTDAEWAEWLDRRGYLLAPPAWLVAGYESDAEYLRHVQRMDEAWRG